MSDLASDPYASIMKLSKAFRNKSVSPSEVMEAQLVRIEAIDPKLGSYQSVYGDAALAAAKEADTAIANDQRLGPFHGIPFALKDIFELEGQSNHLRISRNASENFTNDWNSCTQTIRGGWHCNWKNKNS
jgi:Asp-tRNA(Asn)/Glu-tRNA(Gln) amidotransferase A subunit family amidase